MSAPAEYEIPGKAGKFRLVEGERTGAPHWMPLPPAPDVTP